MLHLLLDILEQCLRCRNYLENTIGHLADSFSQFGFSIDDIAFFDLLSVQCVSNENTTFYSTGSEVTRLEKTAYISDFAVTHKYLNVCWYHLYNCNKCDKCRRTMLGLYALGKLDRYGEVFDVNYFYQNRDEYLGYMLHKRIAENKFEKVVLDYGCNNYLSGLGFLTTDIIAIYELVDTVKYFSKPQHL